MMRRFLPYFYTMPAIALFLLFFIYPIFYIIYLSFMSWNLMSPTKEFVGLDNYKELFQNNEFWQVFSNTLTYTVMTVLISLILSLLCALWLNRKGWATSFLQGAIFSPYIISLVSISLLWMWMMDPQYGLLNWLFSLVGIPPSKWLADTGSALNSLVLVNVWKILGYNTLVFIAGLQSIPKEIYEAAVIDRASWWTKLTRITIPMLSPTLFFLLIVNTINSFHVFDNVQIMTQGGPVNSTNMFVYYIYQYGFDFFKIGYASAAGVILIMLVAIFTIIHFKFLAKRVHYR